jgi:hypothetical protein
MSVLRTTIYPALGNMAVTLNSATVDVFNLDALPNSIQTAQLPCRLLLPTNQQLTGRNAQPVTFGTSGLWAVTWNVVDLVLLEAAGQTRGLLDVAGDVVEYQAAYLAALSALAIGAGITVEGAQLDPGVYTYPASGGVSFFGVQVTVNIKELF